MRDPLPQRTRLLVLGGEAAMLLLGSFIAFGSLLPPNSEKGFWFYTSLFSLVLSNRLATPFFTKPADALTAAASALLAMVIVNSWGAWQVPERIMYCAAVALCGVVLLASGFAMLAKDATRSRVRQLADVARVFSEVVGGPRVVYSVLTAFALFAFHRESAREIFAIAAAWALTVGLSPLEGLARLSARLMHVLQQQQPLQHIGAIAGFQVPGLVLVRQGNAARGGPGDVLLVNDEFEGTRFALALDYVGRDEGMLLRALVEREPIESVAPGETNLRMEFEGVALVEQEVASSITSMLIMKRESVVGLVAPDTSSEKLYFEVTANLGLEEGRLVEVDIGQRTVAYQIVNGLTKEEVVQQKNTFGYVRAQAHKVGAWDTNGETFSNVKWLPQPNAPVFLKKPAALLPNPSFIGHFPGSDYGVALRSIDELVTHNTAILGVLGVGKSSLALELVERMIRQRIKVVCLDLTNQYALELAPYVDQAAHAAMNDVLQTIGSAGKSVVKKNVEEGGSRKAFSSAMFEQLNAFLRPESAAKLCILNPVHFEVWRQDSKPFQDTASMASLTPTEITQIISEAALQVLQAQGMCAKARACLVYEEAHSLIPEWTAIAAEGDRAAANGTARAILQGRKYGLGCLLITQRTASVTKTILNQCNTIFAMRIFDETGKEFLANYIGRDYADSLPALSERHAVLYGRASKCDRPILVRLNDRSDFLTIFRTELPQNEPEDSAIPPF